MLEPLESRIAPSSLITIQDATGDSVTVKLDGAGTANLTLVGAVLNNADIDQIELVGTDLTSKLTVSVATNDTTIGHIVTRDALQSLNKIDLFPNVIIGNGTADATPDIKITGKIQTLLVVEIAANTIIKLGEDLPYDVPNDTKTPDTYNNHPDVTLINIRGAGVELNVVGPGVQAGENGGGGLGDVVIGQWNFPGFIRTTQSIASINVLFGDFYATLEVDKLHFGANTIADLGKFSCPKGTYRPAASEVEGRVNSFNALAFFDGAELTAASLGKTKVGDFDGTITLTDPDSAALPTFVVDSDFTGTLTSKAPVKKLVITGYFMGSLEAPLIGSMSAYAFQGETDLGGVPTTYIRTTSGGLGTLTATHGPIHDFEITTGLAFKGIKVSLGKLTTDTTGLENVKISAASIGNISVSMKADSKASGFQLVGIKDSTFETTGTGTTKKDAGNIGNISVSITGASGGVSATGIINSTFDALVGSIASPGSTANALGNISVKLAGQGGTNLGLSNVTFAGNNIGKTSIDVKRATGGGSTANAINTANVSATGEIGVITATGDASAAQVSQLKVWAGGEVAGVTVKSKDKVNGTLDNSSILAGQSLVLNGATEKDQLALLDLAHLGAVSISGNLTNTSLISGATIGKVTVGGDVSNSMVLAGGTLGGDFTLDGINETWQQVASIGDVTVKGAFTQTTIAAGVNPGDTVFGNSDDLLAAPVNFLELSSSIGTISIAGGSSGAATMDHTHAIEAAAIKGLKLAVAPLTAFPLFLDPATGSEDASDIIVRTLTMSL